MTLQLQFRDRAEAGRLLAEKLKRFHGREEVVILALPRGGVPVGFEISTALQVPLEVFIVRKLGVPAHEELAMGAIASGDTIFLNEQIIGALHIPPRTIEHVIATERQELLRREEKYRDPDQPLILTDKIIILVDDGLATGATMRAAVMGVKTHGPEAIVIAVPVAARETINRLLPEVDEVVAVATPEDFSSVGQWYRDFHQTTDEEVAELLERARCSLAASAQH